MSAFMLPPLWSSNSGRRRRASVSVLTEGEDTEVSKEIERYFLRQVREKVLDSGRNALEESLYMAGNVLGTAPSTQRKLKRPEDLADRNSVFVKAGFPTMKVHCKICEAEEGSARGWDGLMLHGMLGSTFTYRRIQPLLASRMRGKLASMDLPGFGLTERPNLLTWRLLSRDSPYTPGHAEELTRQVMAKLKLTNSVLFGHSMGAPVALSAALNGAPVSGLVLFSPAVKIQQVPFMKQFMNTFLTVPWVGRRAVRKSMEKAVEGDRIYHMIKRNFHDLNRIPLEETIDGYTRPLRVHDWDSGLQQYYLNFDGFNLLEDPRIKRLNIPVLIISGEHDRVLHTNDMDALSKALPNSKFHVLPDCGHIPQEEKPLETYNLIEEWLESLPVPRVGT